jgi:hypothetical protein
MPISFRLRSRTLFCRCTCRSAARAFSSNRTGYQSNGKAVAQARAAASSAARRSRARSSSAWLRSSRSVNKRCLSCSSSPCRPGRSFAAGPGRSLSRVPDPGRAATGCLIPFINSPFLFARFHPGGSTKNPRLTGNRGCGSEIVWLRPSQTGPRCKDCPSRAACWRKRRQLAPGAEELTRCSYSTVLKKHDAGAFVKEYLRQDWSWPAQCPTAPLQEFGRQPPDLPRCACFPPQAVPCWHWKF